MIKIREAKEKDLEQIAKIALACFPEDFVDGTKKESSTKKNALNWIKERFENKTFAKYYVAELNGKVVGYIFHLMLGGLSGIVQLEQIGVDPEHRQKGIGKELILKSEEFWKRYFQNKFKKPLYKILLTTSEINDKAHNLYAKCGFKYETTIKKLYFGNNEEIWIKEFKR